MFSFPFYGRIVLPIDEKNVIKKKKTSCKGIQVKRLTYIFKKSLISRFTALPYDQAANRIQKRCDIKDGRDR